MNVSHRDLPIHKSYILVTLLCLLHISLEFKILMAGNARDY